MSDENVAGSISELNLRVREHELALEAYKTNQQLLVDTLRDQIKGVDDNVSEIKKMVLEHNDNTSKSLKILTEDYQGRKAIKDFVMKLPTLALIAAFIVWASITFKPTKFNTSEAAVLLRDKPAEVTQPVDSTEPKD